MFQNRKRCVKGHLIGFSSFLKVILNNCTSVSGASGLEALADLHVGRDTHLSIFIYYIFPACHQAICCGDPDKKAAAWRHIVIPYQALVLIQYSRSLFCWGGADLIRGHGSQIHRIDWLKPCQWVRGLLLSESILWTRWGICRRCCCLVGIKCVYIFFPASQKCCWFWFEVLSACGKGKWLIDWKKNIESPPSKKQFDVCTHRVSWETWWKLVLTPHDFMVRGVPFDFSYLVINVLCWVVCQPTFC